MTESPHHHTLICPACGYDLSGMVDIERQCPECGRRAHLVRPPLRGATPKLVPLLWALPFLITAPLVVLCAVLVASESSRWQQVLGQILIVPTGILMIVVRLMCKRSV